MGAAVVARARRKGCPLCGRPSAPDLTPFCSAGCKDRDLLQWLGEGYQIPGRPADVSSDPDDLAREKSGEDD